MAERLKDIFFTQSSINTFADTIKRFYSDFNKKKFIDLMFDETFEAKEVKENYKTVDGKVILVKEWPIDTKPNVNPWDRHSALNK